VVALGLQSRIKLHSVGTDRINVKALMLLTLLLQEALDASELPGPLFKCLSGGTPAARSEQAWTISLLTAGLMVGYIMKCMISRAHGSLFQKL
jgi:hypothetical protein